MTLTGKHTNPRTSAVMTVRASSPLSFRITVQHPGQPVSGDMGFGMTREQVALWVSEWIAPLAA